MRRRVEAFLADADVARRAGAEECGDDMLAQLGGVCEVATEDCQCCVRCAVRACD